MAAQSGASLLRAALSGDASAVEALLAANVDPNWQSEDTGSCALHRAAVRGHESVVGILLAARASAELRDTMSGGSAVDVARSRHPGSTILQLLEDAAANERLGSVNGEGSAEQDAEKIAALPAHMQIVAAAYGLRAAEGELGHYTEGHKVTCEEDVRDALECGSTLLYGELLPSSCSELWAALGLSSIKASGVLLELGMGTGKVALQAFAEHPGLRRVFGIELARSRYLLGEQALTSLAAAMPERFRVADLETGQRILLKEKFGDNSSEEEREIEFQCGDMLQVDASEMVAADVMLMQVCLPSSLHPAVCLKTREMKLGAKLFCFADLSHIWPQELDGPQCHMHLCDGADGSAADKRYKTSWSREDGHPFFLMEAGRPRETGLGADALGTQARARLATNPSNDVDDSSCPGESSAAWYHSQRRFIGVVEYNGETSDGGKGLILEPKQEVEVAQRFRLEGRPPTWNKAWVVRVHESGAVDVIYSRGGDMEEFCNPCRIRHLEPSAAPAA